MKKALFTWLTTVALLQGNAQKTIQYGLTADVSLNSFDGKGLSGKYFTGGDGGAYAAIPLHTKWSLQPELLFSYKKGNRAADFTTYYVNEGRDNSSEAIQASYLSLPILLNYQLSKSFTVDAGPQFAYLIYHDENLLKDKNSVLKKWDGGLTAGVQFRVTEGFHLFGNYYYGLININNIDSRYKWYNRSLKLGINCKIF